MALGLWREAAGARIPLRALIFAPRRQKLGRTPSIAHLSLPQQEQTNFRQLQRIMPKAKSKAKSKVTQPPYAIRNYRPFVDIEALMAGLPLERKLELLRITYDDIVGGDEHLPRALFYGLCNAVDPLQLEMERLTARRGRPFKLSGPALAWAVLKAVAMRFEIVRNGTLSPEQFWLKENVGPDCLLMEVGGTWSLGPGVTPLAPAF